MKDKMPRILFAAPKSGSGKTMITCGIIEALKRRNINTASFKCGPDYIDPMFHREVLGIESGNLDTFFTDEETTRYLLWRKAKDADITVLEGVMGYYDGLGGTSERGSTYEIAKVTETPVILVVDGKGASVSLAALIKGMQEYRSDSHIEGIILNRVSAGYYERIKELVERECRVRVFGYISENEKLSLPSRHLGLVFPKEIGETEGNGFAEWIQAVADQCEKTIDMDGIISLAGKAGVCRGESKKIPILPSKVKLAVARDEAFAFYYTENMELLAQMGAELQFFSPLHDKKLPEDIDGMLFGGGYPENYVNQLENAHEMRADIKKAYGQGIPCLAECGGFMYLQQELEGAESGTKKGSNNETGKGTENRTGKKNGKMTGILPGRAYRTRKLNRLGYIEATVSIGGVLGERGEKIKGHEFHYWDCTENGNDFYARKPSGNAGYPCMVHTGRMAAGFPHFYYYSNPEMIYQFLLSCLSFRSGRQAKQHWDGIAKPIDSLGLLEDYTVKLCKIALSPKPYDLKKRALVILCGDHGVVREGVTQTGSEVTRIVSENFAKGCSTVNYMTECAGADIYVVDMGMDTPAYPEKKLITGQVINRKIAPGSGNIAAEPAMTTEQCRQALHTGIELVRELGEKGYRMLATGEMGIGNTTPTSVLAALLLNKTAREVTGKGAGLSGEGLCRKQRVVEQAVKRIKDKLQSCIKNEDGSYMVELLAEAGGYEIVGMTGIFLGGVKYRIPIVIDGAISAVAALAAMQIDRRVPDFVLASHMPEEMSGKQALQAFGAEALLHGRMCLGEGTGAVALFPLLDMAMNVYGNMGSFEDYRIEPYERFKEAGEQ